MAAASAAPLDTRVADRRRLLFGRNGRVARRFYPGVRVITELRRGKGIALMTGFEAATGDVIVMLDADGSMDPEEITSLSSAVVGADFVKAPASFRGLGPSHDAHSTLGNWALTLAVRALYGGSFSDLCYGYIGFWKRHTPLPVGLRRL